MIDDTLAPDDAMCWEQSTWRYFDVGEHANRYPASSNNLHLQSADGPCPRIMASSYIERCMVVSCVQELQCKVTRLNLFMPAFPPDLLYAYFALHNILPVGRFSQQYMSSWLILAFSRGQNPSETLCRCTRRSFRCSV